jgi:hypothetical protein
MPEFQRRFDQLDTNRDGFLDARETGSQIGADKGAKRKVDSTSNRTGESETDSKPSAPKAFASSHQMIELQFSKDYFPGTEDAAGNPHVGTEMMSIAAHAGKP